jgi:hypothetical protein
MSLNPKIAGVVAQQVGNIQGKLTAQVQSEVFKVLTEFTNRCPTPQQIVSILKIKNNLLTNINSLSTRLQTLNSVASKLDVAITSANIIINLIKSTPIPTTIGTPPGPAGGVIVSITVGKVLTVGDRLATAKDLLQSLEADKSGIISIINSASNTVTTLRNRLSAIDAAIEGCSKDSPELQAIVNTLQPKTNTGTEGTPTDSFGQDDSRFLYKGFKLEILQDPNSPAIAPRRFAVARDRRGIVVIKGQPSFSSSTDVLLDEIKFRIDNQRFS